MPARGSTERFGSEGVPAIRAAAGGLVLAVALLAAGCDHGGVATTQPTAAAGQVRYFFVVPQWLPDGRGTGPQRKSLEGWLADKAGGYTQIGPARGGWRHGRDLIEEDSIAYFVVGPAGLKPQLERIIVEQFGQRQAFVVQW